MGYGVLIVVLVVGSSWLMMSRIRGVCVLVFGGDF